MIYYDPGQNTITIPDDEPDVSKLPTRDVDLEAELDKAIESNRVLAQANRELSVEVAELRRMHAVLGRRLPSEQAQKTICFDGEDEQLVVGLLRNFGDALRQVPVLKRRALQARVILFDGADSDKVLHALERLRYMILRGKDLRALSGVEEKKEEKPCG